MQHSQLEKSGGDRRILDVRRADIALVGIYEISKLLAVPARLETSFSAVLQLLASFLDMKHGLIALLDDKGAPEMVVGSGWSDANAKRHFDRLPERAIGRIVVTKMPLVIRQMKKDPLFENWDFSAWGATDEDFSFIGVPIKDRGTVIGTVTIDRENGNGQYFGLDEDVRFLSMIANLLGQTVRLQRLIASDREWLMHEQRRLEKAIAEHSTPQNTRSEPTAGIIGNTPAIKAVLDKVRRVARSHSPVLLRGESGTGKELFARALHEWSPRHEEPFIAVNCAALAETVLESELFGHEKGAFTGATAQRKGRFELADKGTLFLDEIGEISPAFQAKLLRVLQEQEFERVGGNHTIKVDVRIVTATNRNLEEAVARNEFRADLYYRISVVPMLMPPLRDRRSDIPQLAGEFLKRFNAENDRTLTFDAKAMEVLMGCGFPGNVRELENCVQRTATLANGPSIMMDDFACRRNECLSAMLWKSHAELAPQRLRPAIPLPVMPAASTGVATNTGTSASQPAADAVPDPAGSTATNSRPMPDRDRFIEAMEKTGWVQAKAARMLGLTPRQIGYALKKHGIEV